MIVISGRLGQGIFVVLLDIGRARLSRNLSTLLGMPCILLVQHEDALSMGGANGIPSRE